jgi:hypothetical protein
VAEGVFTQRIGGIHTAATVAEAKAAEAAVDRRGRPSSMTELISERPLMEELIKERPLRVSTLDRLARATLERAGRPYTSPAAAAAPGDDDELPCAAATAPAACAASPAACAAAPAACAAAPAACAAPAKASALAATDVPAALAPRVVPGDPIAPQAVTSAAVMGSPRVVPGAVVDSPLPAPPVGIPAAAVPSPGSVRTQRRIHMLMDDIFGD